MGCHALLQGIFLTQGSNLCLLLLLRWQVGSFSLLPPTKFTLIKINLSGEYLGAWNLPSGHSEIESLDNFVIVYDELSKLILTNGQIVERGAPLKVYDLVTSKVTDLLTDEYTNGIIHDFV